ncbi:MAG: tetratricopeptide repeat protein [Longimicrobiaceae bacterium]
MPKDPRRELDLLRDDTGPLGFLLWRIISDVLLWTGCPPDQRAGLFRDAREGRGEPLAYATLAAPELREPLRVLLTVSVTPELADAGAVAEACARVVEWAEGQNMKETAVQFAEAAARIEPEVSRRAYTPGRLCRRLGAHHRSAMWYWRAARLARRAHKLGVRGSEIDFANAHLGLGTLEHGLGRYEQAEHHFLKAAHAALKMGRKSLAAGAHHNLIGVTYEQGRVNEALQHAELAARLYPVGHPFFPRLAHDIGFLWLKQDYFSSALLLFEKVLPWVERQRERILALASLARSAAAVKDHIRFERAATEVLAMAAADNELAASSLYHVAEGERSFWKWDRAELLAQRALRLAEERQNETVVRLARSLLEAVAIHRTGDVDLVPPEQSITDRITTMVLEKLQKQPAPELSSGAVRPEQYPD